MNFELKGSEAKWNIEIDSLTYLLSSDGMIRNQNLISKCVFFADALAEQMGQTYAYCIFRIMHRSVSSFLGI